MFFFITQVTHVFTHVLLQLVWHRVKMVIVGLEDVDSTSVGCTVICKLLFIQVLHVGNKT